MGRDEGKGLWVRRYLIQRAEKKYISEINFTWYLLPFGTRTAESRLYINIYFEQQRQNAIPEKNIQIFVYRSEWIKFHTTLDHSLQLISYNSPQTFFLNIKTIIHADNHLYKVSINVIFRLIMRKESVLSPLEHWLSAVYMIFL